MQDSIAIQLREMEFEFPNFLRRASKMLAALVMMLLVSGVNATTVEVPTYQHKDPHTGQLLTCTRCPPGTHMSAHCTPTRDTVCTPCPEEHFTQYWNFIPKCLYCSVFCVENQHVKEECTPKNNRVCECNDGYFWHADFCIQHSECPSGHGVQKKGTVQCDTKCAKCPRGTFSGVTSSSEPCINHTDCASAGRVVVLNGTSWHDNVCSTCQELNNDGGLSILKDFLPRFFAHQKMRLSKLKMIVRYLCPRRERHSIHSSKKTLLLSFISECINDASIDQLKELPKLLKSKGMHHVAEKLSKIFKKLDISKCDINSSQYY
nr:tumor necrosis factor receptor superfamily member 11B-like [Misgurnus anguillicaudatus]